MEFFGFLTFGLVIAGIGSLVVLVLSIIQEGKLGGKGLSVRHGFYAAVSLVLLTIAVASTIFVVNLALTSWVFTRAPYSRGYDIGTPPAPAVTAVWGQPDGAAKPVPAPDFSYNRQCTSGCDFTAEEIAAVRQWAPEYATWRLKFDPDSALSSARRRDLVNALSFLIVALPLFIIFFRLLRRRDPGEPRVVRSVYFYYVAFTGLVLAVVSGALLVNVALKAATGVTDTPSSYPPTRLTIAQDPNVLLMKSIARCAATCGFTSQEVSLAGQWQRDYETVVQRQQGVGTSKTQGDLAINLPMLAVGLPLFLYHFAQARKDSAEGSEPPKRPRGRPKGSGNPKA